jgi:hypothetical protein
MFWVFPFLCVCVWVGIQYSHQLLGCVLRGPAITTATTVTCCFVSILQTEKTGRQKITDIANIGAKKYLPRSRAVR